MKDILTPIKGFEELYSFTESFRIYSHKSGKIIKTRLRADGYIAVPLYKNGKQKQYFYHRLLAQTYISNPNSYPEVNHKDEDKDNNDISNLEWCTHKYNLNYGTRLKRMAQTNHKPVIQINKNGEIVGRHESQKRAMEITGIESKHISCVSKKGVNQQEDMFGNLSKPKKFTRNGVIITPFVYLCTKLYMKRYDTEYSAIPN